jgi:hypothetical protein
VKALSRGEIPYKPPPKYLQVPRAADSAHHDGGLKMTISDVLFEAREDILDNLEEAGFYEGECRAGAAAIVLAMDKLRLSPGFDLLPGATPLNFPDDATEYLEALLAERARTSDPESDDGGVYVGRGSPEWNALCEQHGRKDAP